MEITYTLEPADYNRYYHYLFQRQVPVYLQIGAPVVLLMPVAYVLLKGGNPLTSTVPVMCLATILVLWLGRREALKAPARRQQQSVERTLRITDAGVQQETAGSTEATSWSGITKVTRTKDLICLFETPQTAYVIPVRVFTDDQAADAFFVKAQRLWQESRRQTS